MWNNNLIIVSMTSWPKRIGNCYTVLKSIIDQTLVPDNIELNLSIIEFPNKYKDLPDDLKNLILDNKIISINWIDRNDGVFKKNNPNNSEILW